MSVTTNTDDPVEMVVDILSGTPDSDYTLDPPDIFEMWEVDPQQRLKKPDPAVYVWSPTPGTIDRFSADGDLQIDGRIIECMILTYDKSETHRYAEDIVDIMGDYVDDNADLTIQEDIDPTGVEDNRGDKIRGRSDHYLMTVEIATERLRTTGTA